MKHGVILALLVSERVQTRPGTGGSSVGDSGAGRRSGGSQPHVLHSQSDEVDFGRYFG